MDDYRLPVTFSLGEVCEAFDISRQRVYALIKDGKVGYSKGKRGAYRFSPAHVEQIREALEVKPTAPSSEDVDLAIGLSRRSIARRRNQSR